MTVVSQQTGLLLRVLAHKGRYGSLVGMVLTRTKVQADARRIEAFMVMVV